MKKKLHFSPHLVPLILSGDKYITWQLWDDKNLSKGDIIDFLELGTERHFATAKLTKVVEKLMGELVEADKKGHEKFKSEEEMYKTYSRYYKRKVGPKTLVKIIRFKLLN